MAKKPPASVTFENAQLIFRNFEGKEGQYNRKGDRNFAIIIPTEELAQQMLQDGWNVKYLNPREEGDDPTPYLQIAVNFQNKPPKIITITSSTRTVLNEETVELLDWAEFSNVDLIFNAYEWEVNGKKGIKAYLKSMYAVLEEDELDLKYAVEDSDHG